VLELPSNLLTAARSAPLVIMWLQIECRTSYITQAYVIQVSLQAVLKLRRIFLIGFPLYSTIYGRVYLEYGTFAEIAFEDVAVGADHRK
jgi:hypothetical protein